MSIGIYLGILSLIGFGFSSSLSKVPSQRIDNIRFIFWRGIFMCSIFGSLLISGIDKSTFNPQGLLYAFSLGIGGFVSLVFLYKALSIGKVGIVIPIANSSVIITVLVSTLVLGESLNLPQILSILLVIVGIMLVSLNFRDLRKSNILDPASGVPFALVTALIWGVQYAFIKYAVQSIGSIFTSFIIDFTVFVCAGIVLLFRKNKVYAIDRVSLKYISIIAVCAAAGVLGYNFGIKFTPASILAPIIFSGPVVAVIYGRFVYKEVIKLYQYLAIVLIITGIILVSYYAK